MAAKNNCRFSIFWQGRESCLQAQHINPIVEAITQADLVILTLPVYGMDVSQAH